METQQTRPHQAASRRGALIRNKVDTEKFANSDNPGDHALVIVYARSILEMKRL